MTEWMLGLAMGLLALWALWMVWGGGAFKRWMQERSLRAAEQFRQGHAVVEAPEVHRAGTPHGQAHPPMTGSPAHGPKHRSGQRHH